MNSTYVSLADRVQQQTGIPYALLDGRFDGGAGLSHARRADRAARAGEELARITDKTMRSITGPDRGYPSLTPARLLRARARDSRPGSAARSTSRRSSFWRRTSGARPAAGSPPSRSSRCCCGIPTSSSPSTGICGWRTQRGGWAPVKAVRDGRVHLAKAAVRLGRFSACVNRLIGLRWLAKILYPDLFPRTCARSPAISTPASIT